MGLTVKLASDRLTLNVLQYLLRKELIEFIPRSFRCDEIWLAAGTNCFWIVNEAMNLRSFVIRIQKYFLFGYLEEIATN